MFRHSPFSSLPGTFAFLLTLLTAVGAETETKISDDPGWPRTYQAGGHEVVIYQPQPTLWKEFQRLEAKAAMALKVPGKENPFFGAIYVNGQTETHSANRTVLISDLQIERIHFPNIETSESLSLENLVRKVLPTDKTMLLSLDRLVAALNAGEHDLRQIEVNLDPPPIFYSASDAILIIFLGQPRFERVEGTKLLFATNTNWDLFQDTTSGFYYLLNEDSWMKTRQLESGSWEPTVATAELISLPETEDWVEVRRHITAPVKSDAPKVFVSNQPAELILLNGPPVYELISSTRLMHIKNTESDLFLFAGDAHHYFLSAGRWFRSKELSGPWNPATKDLPEDFLKIPSGHDKGYILASVPGSPDAEAAVLLASVPTIATVDRNETTVKVTYDGEPEFKVISRTSGPVYYGINTPQCVFRVKSEFYCCHQAVWFKAPAPDGPWEVATSVPKDIYSIPTSHPTHNVTYVHVYESTPTTVVVGHTSGYTGAYVVGDVVMFGLGVWALSEMLDDDHYHWHYHYHHAHYFSYGCGARYAYHHGGYYRSAHVYGPYGGAGRGAVFNPVTGSWRRGSYMYGPYGGAFAREAYNPHTGRYAAQARASNPYGSWGRTVVTDGRDWARAGHRSNWERSIAGFENSKGAAGLAGRNNLTGNQGFAVRNKYGDAYVGRNGNIYKREDGQWQQSTRKGWQNSGIRNVETQRPGVTSRSTTSQRSSANLLNRQHQSRQLGERNASLFRSRGSSLSSRRGISRGGGRRR